MTNTVDTKPFEWTDELVKEFVATVWTNSEKCSNNPEKFLQYFKQSKSIPNKQDKSVSVSHIMPHDTFKGNGWDSFFYQFCSSELIQTDKFPAIKQAIESCLNEPCPTKPSTTPTEDKGNVLFTTYDGVDYYEDNKGAWWVDVRDFRIGHQSRISKEGASNNNFKYFSNEQAAKDWVLENKPCLSLVDVMNVIESKRWNFSSETDPAKIYRDMRDATNKKLNQ